MEIEFLGAAQTVTGSMHLVRAKGATVLLDCGLFQGRRQEALDRNRNFPIEVGDLDAVILSHAHIDHSGALPLLAKHGYRGPVYATPATRDLCAVMLEDAAAIQQTDARYIAKLIRRGHSELKPVEPLYDGEDVATIMGQMLAVPYRRRETVAPGVSVTFLDAGHVLGSAVVVLDVDEDGRTKRLVFTGDLGRRSMPILRDPEVATGAETLITESTYGDRLHEPIAAMDEHLADAFERTYRRGGKVIIPSFALERAQEIIFAVKRLKAAKRMPPMPVYVDSPLTVKITQVFRMHPECFDKDTRVAVQSADGPFDFEGLRYVSSVEDSKQIGAEAGAAVVISASGMCEGGRVLHHLRGALESEKNTVLIVGFQAQHTLGRRLVERRDKVRVFGLELDRRCEVVVLNGFSAHADQSDLLQYVEAVRERGPLRQVALVHGELPAQQVLAGLLGERGFPQVTIPARGDVLTM